MIIRSIQIVWAGSLFLLDFLTAVTLRRLGVRQRMNTLPDRTTRRLERLGPTFVKLGQALSERRDFLPPSWTDRLSRLQSQVPPFPAAVAVDIVEKALGADTETLFATFERTPLAAGSVAQVHAAQLHDGRDAVVKILRPKVGGAIRRDMRILLMMVRVIQHLVPAAKRHRAAELVQEIARGLRQETDLKQEARSIRRFARAFADSQTVYMPDVIDELSGATVITQERSMGTPLDTIEPLERGKAVSETFVEFYLKQFFVLGVFHADPHPGNLLMMPDGRLCVHDFGAVGRLDPRTRESLLGFVAAFNYLDSDWLADAAVDLGLVADTADRAALARGIDGILADLQGATMAEWSLARTMVDIGRLSAGGTFLLPPHLAGLVRTVFTAESTLRKLNPDVDLLQLLQTSGNRLLASGDGEILGNGGSPRLKWEVARFSRRGPAIAADWMRRLSQAPQPFGSLAHDSKITQTARPIALGLTALGSYLAAGLFMLADRGPRVWGDIPLLAALVLAVALVLTAMILLRAYHRPAER